VSEATDRNLCVIMMHPVLFCFLQIDYPEVQGGRGDGVGGGGRGSVTSSNMDRSVNLVFEDTVIISNFVSCVVHLVDKLI
jgi:hypothetical protein